MSCCSKDECGGGAGRILMLVALMTFGALVVACLPEIRRYIKISTM